MKKEYVKPICESIAFEINEVLMSDDEFEVGDGPGSMQEGVEDW